KSRKDSITAFRGNLVKDPGFEDTSSPGIPASTYARNGGDRGATFFTDNREHVEGNQSVRLVTPTDNGGTKLRFFPVNAARGRTYILSLWAKTDPEQDHRDTIFKNRRHYFRVSLGESGTSEFNLGSEWKQYATYFTIPANSELPPRTNIILEMPSAGVGWFDMVQLFEAVDVKKCRVPGAF
ncbi:MAG: hypothetical protein IQL11_16145, partial [Bacteroidales bacterium]|nr:hypothetical protein [Bacteroidales bacterium]